MVPSLRIAKLQSFLRLLHTNCLLLRQRCAIRLLLPCSLLPKKCFVLLIRSQLRLRFLYLAIVLLALSPSLNFLLRDLLTKNVIRCLHGLMANVLLHHFLLCLALLVVCFVLGYPLIERGLLLLLQRSCLGDVVLLPTLLLSINGSVVVAVLLLLVLLIDDIGICAISICHSLSHLSLTPLLVLHHLVLDHLVGLLVQHCFPLLHPTLLRIHLLPNTLKHLSLLLRFLLTLRLNNSLSMLCVLGVVLSQLLLV
jgi:hypothetical protein